MSGFTIGEMQEMQNKLQEKYKWEPLGPGAVRTKLLYTIGEIGEVIDIVKKKGDGAACEPGETREHFVEELADVLMYYNEVLLCYGIDENELKDAYVKKFERNMKRW